MADLLERLSSTLGGRYAIQSEIGRGGMAVVFLAEDLKHHRNVALKVLHPELTATLGAERFLKEIEIVAGLQHPHILPLYDSGEADGLLYYVMPFAEGESLRQRLDRERQLAVDESVRIAVEVADGLDYAHQRGVVHRDIKPGNILLSARHAVIADFGIARAVEAAQRERITSTGLGVGTPLYASPEQATAQETLDGRTDIYSLGCVLYEMLAGEPPLSGATPQIIQAKRVSETPSPLHGLRDTVPPALDHVIARALAKIPADRYATASQFAQALQAVLLASTPSLQADPYATPTAMTTTPRGVSGEEAGRSRRWWWLAVPILAVLVLVVLWPPGGWFRDGPLEITTANRVQITRDPGVEFQPAISPDGREVAFITGSLARPPRGRIVVRSTIDVASGETRPSEPLGGQHWLPSWTQDGASLRFRVVGLEEEDGWKQVGRLGGSIRSLQVPNEGRMAWSRDGRLAVSCWNDSIYVYETPDGDPELIGVQLIDPWTPHSFDWSPDGRWVAYVNGNSYWRWGHNVSGASIWILSTAGGKPIQIVDDSQMNLSPKWLPDSRHLLFVSDRDGSRAVYVLEVGPDGPKRGPRIVPGVSRPHSISVSEDGRKLAWSDFTATMRVVSVPIPSRGSVSIRTGTPITTGNQVIEVHDVSPDGEWLAFDSDIRGQFDIYRQRMTGGEPVLVADAPDDAFAPAWSPDGKEIAFYAGSRETSGGKSEVFVVAAAGGSPQQLTFFPGFDNHPVWSPDGLAIAFQSQGPEGRFLQIWVVERPGPGEPWGKPARLSDTWCALPDWAPDGRSLVCDAGDEIVRISRGGEVLLRTSLRALGVSDPAYPKFSADGARIYFLATGPDDSRGAWWLPAEGGSPTAVVAFDDPSLDVSFMRVEPQQLNFTVGRYDSDIWVADLEW